MPPSSTDTSATPPPAWMTMLISPSYIAIETRRTISGDSPSSLRFFFTSTDALPAEVKSLPFTS